MHQAARDWVQRFACPDLVTVLDIGGRNINGSVRDLFPGSTRYVSVDLHPGPDVDVVADVTVWENDERFDVVVCCEVLEHAGNWEDIVDAAHKHLKPGGLFILTCAGPDRVPHSALDGGGLRPGEYYGNLTGDGLQDVLIRTDWSTFTIDDTGEDVRCVAVRW